MKEVGNLWRLWRANESLDRRERACCSIQFGVNNHTPYNIKLIIIIVPHN